MLSDRIRIAHQEAIKAIEEVQQYREIGTIEEFQKLKKLFGDDSANLSEVVKRISKEYPAYQSIGTVEECEMAINEKKTREQSLPFGLLVAVGEEVYRIWTVGGKKVIATFVVTSYVSNAKNHFIYVKSKGEQGTTRVWPVTELGKTVFVTREGAEALLKGDL